MDDKEKITPEEETAQFAAESEAAAQDETAENAAEAVEAEAAAEAAAEAEVQKKYDSLNEKYLRTLAEYDNYRKRSIREREAIYPEARADTAAAFLPVMDSLERALGSETEKSPFYEGVALVKKQLDEVFAKLGVEVVEAAAGAAFDPELHNAVMHVEDGSMGENVIVEELQKGYKIGNRVIRHSMVKVAN